MTWGYRWLAADGKRQSHRKTQGSSDIQGQVGHHVELLTVKSGGPRQTTITRALNVRQARG